MAIPVTEGTPQFDPQNVDLGLRTDEQTGEIMKNAFNELGKAGIDARKLISNNTMLKQANSFQDEINDARLNVLTNPSDSNIRAQQARVDHAADTSLQVPLTRDDQNTMQHTVITSRFGFDYQAAKMLNQNAKRSQYMDFQNTFTDTLNNVHSLAAQGDINGASQLGDSQKNKINSLVMQGVIPPAAADRFNSSIDAIVSRGQDVFTKGPANADDPTQQAYDNNYAFSNGASPDSAPQKLSTQFQFNANMNAQDAQSARKLAAQGILPSAYLTNYKISDGDYSHMYDYYEGATYAKAQVQTGLNYNMLQVEKQHLDSQKLILTPHEEGIRDALGVIDNQIKTNYFDYYTSQTNGGKEALTQYNATVTAIKEANIPLAQKQQQLADAEAQFRRSAVTYGQVMKIPAQYIKPFAPDDPTVLQTQQGFQAGADVSTAVQILRQKNATTPYLSGSMASPVQQEAAHLVSNAPNNDGATLIMQANQNLFQGTSIDAVDSDGKKVSGKVFSTSLYAQPAVAHYLQFVSNQPNGAQRVSSIQKTLTNAVRYCMATNSGNDVDSCSKYVNNNGVPSEDNYVEGSTDGANYHFLNSELPQKLSTNDAMAVAQYLSNRGHEIIKTISGLDPNSVDDMANLDARKMTNPLQVSNGPDGQLIVYDGQTGKGIYQTSLTPDLLVAARKAAAPVSIAEYRKNAPQINSQGLDALAFPQYSDQNAFAQTRKLDEIHKNIIKGGN